MTDEALVDRVPRDAAGSREIGFSVPERYNAASILFDNLERGFGDKVAVYSDDGNITYRDLARDACRFGSALKALGLEPGARVAMVLDDTAAYPAAVFGALAAGFVPVLLNTASPPDLVEYFLDDSRAPVLVIEGSLATLVRDGIGERLAALRHVVVVGGDSRGPAGPAWHDFRTLLDAHDDELVPADTGRDDMAFWMYSSGSTGRPKGIVHLHHDMLYTHLAYGRGVLDIGPGDVCFSPPKIFFAYGFGNSVTFPFAAGAASVLMAGRPTAEAVFDAVERHRPTLFFGLPTLYNALINSDRAAAGSLDSVRLCLSAAETLPAELAARWRERFGHAIVEGLGSTEVLHIYLSNRPGDIRTGAAGRRVPGYELRLVDDEEREVRDGEAGTLWVRGDSQTPGYWNKPDKTAETLHDGWIVTGDRFKRDADGFHYFLGRADDLVKVSGQWVYPLEVEHCLADHEAVRECAVLAVRLDDGRTTLKAFVVLNEPAEAGDAMTERPAGYVKRALLPYKYPRIVEYVEQLPKTGTGKIDRQALAGREGRGPG
ncbi:MAG: benzoate-CoA ligase family protein [Gammaproteobacteria bacterium]|nr:benzoate-CoA ligase family protein [Gammaproteobacteria bacterium]